MHIILSALLHLLIVGLFVYSKLTPHKARLEGNYLKTYNFFERIFEPVFNFIRSFAKPLKVGNGLSVDISQIFLLLIFLLLLNLIS